MAASISLPRTHFGALVMSFVLDSSTPTAGAIAGLLKPGNADTRLSILSLQMIPKRADSFVHGRVTHLQTFSARDPAEDRSASTFVTHKCRGSRNDRKSSPPESPHRTRHVPSLSDQENPL